MCKLRSVVQQMHAVRIYVGQYNIYMLHHVYYIFFIYDI